MLCVCRVNIHSVCFLCLLIYQLAGCFSGVLSMKGFYRAQNCRYFHFAIWNCCSFFMDFDNPVQQCIMAFYMDMDTIKKMVNRQIRKCVCVCFFLNRTNKLKSMEMALICWTPKKIHN